MIRKCAAEKNLAGVKAAFEAAETDGAELNVFVYSAPLDACVERQDLWVAHDVMELMRRAGMNDFVTFGALIEADLQTRAVCKATCLD